MKATLRNILFWAMGDGLKIPTLSLLLQHFGSLDAIPHTLTADDLCKMGMVKRSAESLANKMQGVSLEKLDHAQMLMSQRGYSLMWYYDEDFPESLKNISDPPLFLFYKGDMKKLPRRSLAVVGTRSPSQDGAYAIQKIIPPLVSSGFCIVSGLALGIDTLAHKQALQSGGSTVAFLGSGIDMIYPSSNQSLAHEIVQKGGVVFSEFPLGTRPDPYNFPRRNRLVSGFSEGVLIVEGKEKSGSLITADFAMEQGKEVFAVPGSIRNELSMGPHKLIADGACLVQSAEDILSVFGLTESSSSSLSDDTLFSSLEPMQQKIYSTLSHIPLPFDVLQQKVSLSSSELSSELMMMTLLGIVEEIGGSWVRR